MPQHPDILPRAFAIVPAAGASRRMGAAKLLLPWGERTVVESLIAAYRRCDLAAIVVVVAPGDDTLATLCRAAGADVVVPPAAPADMKASLQAGLAALAERHRPMQSDAVLIAPADMPWLQSETVDRLLARFADGGSPIVIPTHAGARGHPVVLSWSLAEEVLALSEGQTLKTVIAHHAAELVECDAAVLGDLDTPEDYCAACQRYAIAISPVNT